MNPELKLTSVAAGPDGVALVTAWLGDKPIAHMRVVLSDPADRARFCEVVCRGRPGIDPAKLEDWVLTLAAEYAEEQSDRKPAQSTELVQLAVEAELFHTQAQEPYARVPVRDHHETLSLDGTDFQHWLRYKYDLAYDKPPRAQSLRDAVELLKSRAIHAGPCQEVFIRVGEHGGYVYLDLCDDRWRGVEVGPGGWRVVTDPPVRFVRKTGMLSLPEPERGGRVLELRTFVNVGSDDDFVLMVAWLVAALRPRGPYPILVLNGEQGSAKSTTCRMLRALVDPNYADARFPPTDERDLVIAAGNGHVLAFDNISVISAKLSDALCRIATGESFGTRKLYTNDEEKLFRACRPIVFNGIGELATRPDLVERSLTVTLPTIPETRRMTEEDLLRRFDERRPFLLGALLDAVCEAVRNLRHVRLSHPPRMADFVAWVRAASGALPHSAERFEAAYAANREAAIDVALEGSPVGMAIASFMETAKFWQGTATELLKALEGYRQELADGPVLGWPRQPNTLSSALRRLAPALRHVGIQCTFNIRGTERLRRRLLRLERVDESSSAPSASSDPPGPTAVPSRHPVATPPADAAHADGADGADDQTVSLYAKSIE